MKIKILIFVAIVIQLGALFFVAAQIIEPRDAIEIGLVKLKDNCPAQALTITNPTANVWTIKTAGDDFFMAENWYQFIIKTLCLFTLINICFLSALFFMVRKNTPASK
jgi:hypothetical protein